MKSKNGQIELSRVVPTHCTSFLSSPLLKHVFQVSQTCCPSYIEALAECTAKQSSERCSGGRLAVWLRHRRLICNPLAQACFCTYDQVFVSSVRVHLAVLQSHVSQPQAMMGLRGAAEQSLSRSPQLEESAAHSAREVSK